MAIRRVRTPFVGRGSAMTRVNRLATVLDRMMEKKAIDYTFSSGVAGLDAGGLIFDVSNIAQGDDRSSRTGLTISPVALYLKGFFTASPTDRINSARVIVFRWNDTTAPLVTDVIEASFADRTIAPYNWANSGTKLHILHDKILTSDNAADTWRSDDRLRITFKPTDQIRYTGPAGNSGVSGRVFLLMLSDSSVLPHPACNYSGRLVFRDA